MTADTMSEVTVGEKVLAHDGEAWYRAQVIKLLP